ncbi:hypothetical protein E2C01_003512 [Portunus trituberculatus]|uniref:Uncharacterized protein n=1 Tax=Portunus trituberculatus TaxID=210409 RepID=A0A5B7CN16_PORTR|nr:hypothetical protein [Portunus trituberculatus]
MHSQCFLGHACQHICLPLCVSSEVLALFLSSFRVRALYSNQVSVNSAATAASTTSTTSGMATACLSNLTMLTEGQRITFSRSGDTPAILRWSQQLHAVPWCGTVAAAPTHAEQ